MLSIFISLIFAVTLGGGVSIAANSAMPGDVLYPFKINVNEKVEEKLTQSSDAAVTLHLANMEERLTEATQLATKGALDEKTAQRLAENFNTHTRAVGGAITRLQATGNTAAAAELATKFQATLTRQTATLVDMGAKNTAPVQTSLASVLASVQAALGAAALTSAKASAQAAVEQ